MTVLIIEPEGYSKHALDLYSRHGKVWAGRVPVGAEDGVKLIVARLGYRLDRRYLEKYSSLVAIATPTTGLTHIDLEYCTCRGVDIFSLADCREAINEITSTSELTIGLMISLLRKIPSAYNDVCVGNKWVRDPFRSRQLSRLTIGLIGLGRIGGHVSGYAQAFGMRVVGYDPYQAISRFTALGVKRLELHSLLRESDIISIHASLRKDNNNLLGSKEISQLKQNSLIINTARGELMDEELIAKAVKTGRIGGVAVDVLANEYSVNFPTDSPLVSAAREGNNVIVTPHIGGCTSDAMHLTEDRVAEHVVQSLRLV